MKKVYRIAKREVVVTVMNKAFLIGLLIMPAMIAVIALIAPRVFNFQNFKVDGEIRVIDPTGQAMADLRTTLEKRKDVALRAKEAREAMEKAPPAVRNMASNVPDKALQNALGPVPNLTLVERPATSDLQKEKAWLIEEKQDPKHLALIVFNNDALAPAEGKTEYGSYDLYVGQNLDDRVDSEIQQSLRDALISARVKTKSMDRDTIDAIVKIPRVQSVTVTKEAERKSVPVFNFILPVVVAGLLFMGVMMGGQSLLTSTVEEKSSRVIEVLLSAVSPMQLMAGKLIGQMLVSLLVLSLYIGMGLAFLTSLSLFGLFDPWLIAYILIFFVIMYLVFGSLMMAIGAAVNEMREAQGLMAPLMMMLMLPWFLWMPISRDPNSVFSTVLSFVPPVNTFAMLLRMSSSAPPPWWQVWLSIGVGVLSVFGALWFAAKVFRIGLLMYGKPPSLGTLIRWAREA
jgi:ABC-2 type transport system permease protein